MKKLTIKDFEKRPADEVIKDIRNNNVSISVRNYNKVLDYSDDIERFDSKKAFWYYIASEFGSDDNLRNKILFNQYLNFYNSPLYNGRKVIIMDLTIVNYILIIFCAITLFITWNYSRLMEWFF